MYFISKQNAKINVTFYESKEIILGTMVYQYSGASGMLETVGNRNINFKATLGTLETGKYLIEKH